jgi:hypothetical protein
MAKTTPSMQIFRAACDDLGAFLASYGFKYLKSKRTCTRQGTLFEQIISFGTFRSTNMLGGVALDVRASAWSKELAEYRKNAGIELSINEAVLFAIDIENLFRPAPPYIRYDIGDPGTRDEILIKIKDVLQSEVFAAFDIAEDPVAFEAAANAQLLPCLDDDAIRDYPTCFTARPRWLTSTVIGMASGILDEPAPTRFAILADALEESGYTNAYVLTRCREKRPKKKDHQFIQEFANAIIAPKKKS